MMVMLWGFSRSPSDATLESGFFIVCCIMHVDILPETWHDRCKSNATLIYLASMSSDGSSCATVATVAHAPLLHIIIYPMALRAGRLCS